MAAEAGEELIEAILTEGARSAAWIVPRDVLRHEAVTGKLSRD